MPTIQARKQAPGKTTAPSAELAVIAELTAPVRPLTCDIHAHALRLARSSALSLYDARFVAAAADAHCRDLLTEDLQQGHKFGGATVEIQFLE